MEGLGILIYDTLIMGSINNLDIVTESVSYILQHIVDENRYGNNKANP